MPPVNTPTQQLLEALVYASALEVTHFPLEQVGTVVDVAGAQILPVDISKHFAPSIVVQSESAVQESPNFVAAVAKKGENIKNIPSAKDAIIFRYLCFINFVISTEPERRVEKSHTF